MPDLLKVDWVIHPDQDNNRLPITSLDIHTKQKKFVTGGNDKAARIWDLESILNPLKDDKKRVRAISVLEHHESLNCVRWSPDGILIATAGSAGTITIWKKIEDSTTPTERWEVFDSYKAHQSDVSDICWSPEGEKIASCATDSKVLIWDLMERKIIKSWVQEGNPRGIDWSSGGSYIAVQGDKSMCIYREGGLFATLTDTFKASSSKYFFKRPSWSSHGKFIAASGGTSDEFHCSPIYEQPSFNLAYNIRPLNSAVVCCRYNPNLYISDKSQDPDCYIGFGMMNGSVVIFSHGELVLLIENFFGQAVNDLAWSPSGNCILGCSNDGTVGACVFQSNELPEHLSKKEFDKYFKKLYGVAPSRKSIGTELEKRRKSTSSDGIQENKKDENIKRIRPELVPPMPGSENIYKNSQFNVFNIISSPPSTQMNHDVVTPSSQHPVLNMSSNGSTNQLQLSVPTQPSPYTMLTSSNGSNIPTVSASVSNTPETTSPEKSNTGKKEKRSKSKTRDAMEIESIIENDETSTKGENTEVEDEKKDQKSKKIEKKRKREDEESKSKKKQKPAPVAEEVEEVEYITDEESEEESLLPSIPIPEKKIRFVKEISKDIFLEVHVKEDAHESIITCISSNNIQWTIIIDDTISTLSGNKNFCVLGCFSGNLYIYSATGRRLLPCINLSSQPICFVDCNETNVLAVAADGELRNWDINAKMSVLNCNIFPFLKTQHTKILKMKLHKHQLVYAILNNGNTYYYDNALKTWVQVFDIYFNNADSDPFKNTPPGPIHDIEKDARDSIPFNLELGTNYNEESKKLQSITYLEHQLALSEILKSPEEYVYWLKRYVLKLSNELQEEKLKELCSELLGPPYIPSKLTKEEEEKSSWKPTILGKEKRKLLEEVLNVISNRSLQSLVLTFKLDLAEIEKKYK